MARFRHVDVIEVGIWGSRVGAVAADPQLKAYVFEYDPQWARSGIQLAPLTMPVAADSGRSFTFPELDEPTFKGLPGLLSDALPDKFGNQLIDAWMVRKGYRPAQITTLDRLAYMNRRAMGALEFRPARGGQVASSVPLQMGRLVEQARLAFKGQLDAGDSAGQALNQLISVGTSAGGARAKAVIGWNPDTGEMIAGQFDLPGGFEHWLLKFDGTGHDQGLGPSQQYGRIEYAYSRMATWAGVTMQPCRLHQEGGRAHFMTRRFDRDGNDKAHVQSLCALRHMSYNQVHTHAYESLFLAARDLGLGDAAMTQLFARMAFNVAARNQDDHTRNFAFLMRRGQPWALAPAYDITFAMDPGNRWLAAHQMSVNGRFQDIARDDLLAVAAQFSVPRVAPTLERINSAIARWPGFGAEAGVSAQEVARIGALHRRI